ncbi:hypothetical protein MVEG_11683 [Podila verticillata NRRL 6337]|uniref:Tail specific protease domain-containing protein n=1 Tax=Podila verticillata NRRL 6337 TaxID=1069443 RepID=A0A086TKJ7_9FUNG|nr:hypothetical protein MVEG_11683 [Podila verticillata NRRL 6337]
MLSLAKLLLLSTALAAVASAAPTQESNYPDYCSLLAKAQPGQITYQQVANCYRSVDFNLKQAKEAIDTLTTFYNDAFVFRDVAMTPNLKAPFTTSPVDAIASLKKIGQKQYKNDFDFHHDLALLAMSFNDAHTTYAPQCYSSHIFLQPLQLYAPVINGTQSIRVYHDATKSGFENCEVQRINGENPREAGFSKDAGVRFNHALASHRYWAKTKVWLDFPGLFSFQPRLPETPYVDYVLKCDGRYAEKFRGQWEVLSIVPDGSFTDRESFVSNLCMHSKPDANSQPKNVMDPNALDTLLGMLYEREHGEQDPSLKDLPDAKLWASNNTAVYQLKSMPHIGVLVVPSMEMESKTEIPAIQEYLSLIAKHGVTNIIIDMSGNFGGEEEFSALLPGVFFDIRGDKSLHAHKTRFRVTPAIQRLAETDLHDTEHSTYWDPTNLADIETFTPFKTNPFTSRVVDLTFNGRSAAFSQQVYGNYDQNIIDSSITHPWSNDPSKIIILTDSQCGSACGMTSNYFVHRHGVKAVAVGGHNNTPLSVFSFPGASVLDTDAYIDSFEQLGLKPTIQRLPYANSASVGVTLDYSGNDTVPLEYNPTRFPAAYRLDYTPATAYNHDQLWAAVAKTAWK